MITTAPHLDEPFWICKCIYCSAHREVLLSREPKVKPWIEKIGWFWFRTSLGSLDCSCPAKECRDRLMREAGKMRNLGVLEESSFDILNEEKK